MSLDARLKAGHDVNRRRHCERSEAISSLVLLLDCFVASLLAMTVLAMSQ
ncbi:MAG: hypothetical protein L0Y60_09605 [Beijerinckiaceae bacterium]|nr:hypothetical protein [Beijerinckiaceae bacterium]